MSLLIGNIAKIGNTAKLQLRQVLYIYIYKSNLYLNFGSFQKIFSLKLIFLHSQLLLSVSVFLCIKKVTKQHICKI